jgi:hypothetical protein
LHDRWFSAGGTTDGALESWVSTQAGVDLTEAVSAGENGDKSIVEFFYLLFDGFLFYEAMFGKRLQEV